MGVDLPLFDTHRGAIAVEKATREKLYDEYISRIHEARGQIAQTLAEIRSVEEQIQAGVVSIPILERLVQTYEEAVKLGQADILSFYGAQNDLAKKKLDLIRLKLTLQDWAGWPRRSGSSSTTASS
jgi:outer membrane protein, heavy metal efflux system